MFAFARQRKDRSCADCESAMGRVAAVTGPLRCATLCALAALLALLALGAPGALGAQPAEEGQEAPARLQIKPSLECSCRSWSGGSERFDLNCQHAPGATVTKPAEAAKYEKTEESSFSCSPGGPGSSSKDWWFAEVPDFGVYRMSTRFLTWSEAEDACEAVKEQQVALDGGDDEMKALLTAFENVGTDGNQLFWAGIRYFEDERTFYTVRGQKMVNLTWRSDFPQIRKNEDCVILAREAKLRGPRSCTGKRRFFCKG